MFQMLKIFVWLYDPHTPVSLLKNNPVFIVNQIIWKMVKKETLIVLVQFELTTDNWIDNWQCIWTGKLTNWQNWQMGWSGLDRTVCFDCTNFSWTSFFVPVREHNKCAECDTVTLWELFFSYYKFFMNRFIVPVREYSNFHPNSQTLFLCTPQMCRMCKMAVERK